jgi:hypothetical protein
MLRHAAKHLRIFWFSNEFLVMRARIGVGSMLASPVPLLPKQKRLRTHYRIVYIFCAHQEEF